MNNTVTDPNIQQLWENRKPQLWEKLNAPQILLAMEHICGELEQLHDCGYLSLNLRPECILFREDAGLVLAENIPLNSVCDPGSSQKWILPPEKTYTAPELLWGISDSYFQRRRMQQYGQQADIYSLGLILCQILFGWKHMTFERRCDTIPELLSNPLEPRELDPRFCRLPAEALEKLRLLLREMLAAHSFNRLPSMAPVKNRLCEIRDLLPRDL